MGEEVVLSCNGSALVDWCSKKSNECTEIRNIKNTTFDISVNQIPIGRSEISLFIFIQPSHANLMSLSYNATKLHDKNTWAVSIGDKNNADRNRKGLVHNDISINRLSGNFKTFYIRTTNEGKMTQVYSGNCREVTTQKF